MTDAVAHYLSEYARRAPTPPWLQAQQQSSVDAFCRAGFPTLKNEDWKYTDVGPLTKQLFSVPDQAPPQPDTALADTLRFTNLDCHELVFINGLHAPELSFGGKTAAGIIIQPLALALAGDPDRLQPYLNRAVNAAKNAFTALNTALIKDGAVILLPDDAVLDKPVHLMFLSTRQDPACASLPRNLIVLGRNAAATVIESYLGADEAEYFTNAQTEVILEQGARLQHYKIQREGQQGFHVGNLQVLQHGDSRLESHAVSLGGRLARSDIDVSLAEPGAAVLLNGLYLAGGRQHVDNHTRIDHLTPHTTSEETYRGVLNDRARGVFNGKVVVHQDAQKTDASQSNANLLLSNDAEVDTKPELEIYADDVKCSHGATIGRLDQDMLFYLRSRAIPEDTARSLLTFAFADEVISRMPLQAVRDRLEYLIVGRLPDAEHIREFVK
jgi:Fe-S cluster assembly protein SufD